MSDSVACGERDIYERGVLEMVKVVNREMNRKEL